MGIQESGREESKEKPAQQDSALARFWRHTQDNDGGGRERGEREAERGNVVNARQSEGAAWPATRNSRPDRW